MQNENKEVAVSVLCVSFNHERYIARALDSFLAQETDFNYEIIIADDCSTDSTLSILRSYESNFPEIIRVLDSAKNLGAMENGRRALSAGRGKYFAICDGDDFFISKNKLKTSYDFMEANDDVSMVFTPALEVNEATGHKKIRNRYSKDEISKIDLNWVLQKGGGFFPTCSSFYRSSVFNNLPEWFYLHSTGDYPCAIQAILNGRIEYIDYVTACYWRNYYSISNKRYEEISSGKFALYEKYLVNLRFIEYLFEGGVIGCNNKKNLMAKEDYVYYSKISKLGLYRDAIQGVKNIRYSLYYRLRIILKIIHDYFKIRNQKY